MADGRKYRLFSLTLESDQAIPDLPPAPSDADIDIRCFLGTLPECATRIPRSELTLWHAAVETDNAGRPRRVIWQIPNTSYYLLEYFDGHRFVFNREATEVWAEWPANSNLPDSLTYLLGPLFGILLSLRGVTCLHASCIAFGDGCVAFVGTPEAGKSTTAAAFALRGRPVLSDDITTLEARGTEIVVRPAYPRIRLWAPSAEVLGVRLEQLPLLTPTWDKRYLDLRGPGLAFAGAVLPLRAVYILQPRADEPQRPYAEPTTARDALLALLANVYVAQLPDEGRSTRDFPVLGAIAHRLPVRKIFPSSEPSRLDELCALIEQDLPADAAGIRAAHV